MGDWLTEPVPGEENHRPAPQPIMFDVSTGGGCLLDGALGYTHNGLRTIDLAVAHNWPGYTEADREVCTRIHGDLYNVTTESQEQQASDIVVFDEIIDEATAFLAEHCCPPGWTVQWHDGDLMLWTLAASCEASGDRCDDAEHEHVYEATTP